jgi:hypothetical protein
MVYDQWMMSSLEKEPIEASLTVPLRAKMSDRMLLASRKLKECALCAYQVHPRSRAGISQQSERTMCRGRECDRYMFHLKHVLTLCVNDQSRGYTQRVLTQN